MSKNWVQDIRDMHDHFGMSEKFEKMDQRTKMQFLLFRERFLREEMSELHGAIGASNGEPPNKAEIVDALIDLCVVAIGTLDAFGIDADKAWNLVLQANMLKEPGVKESRPNPFGLPDLIKPEGWVAPDHSDNTGRL